jgi:hypothetical protein
MKQFLCVGLVGLAVAMFGCASGEDRPEPTDLDVGSQQSAWTSPENHWQHNGSQFDCGQGVQGAFSAQKRRQFFSFPGEKGRQSHFDFNGKWSHSLGAVLIVTDVNYNILALDVHVVGRHAEVDVTPSTTGKHFVFVSPYKYWNVYSPVSFSLQAKCEALGCTENNDCQFGESCIKPVCIKAPCDFPGQCIAQPLCAEFTTSDGRYYAKNFPAGQADAAKAWVTIDPMVEISGVNAGFCSDLNAKACDPQDPPVCGSVKFADEYSTFTSVCEFQKAVREQAGTTGEYKGRYTEGACEKGEAKQCATLSFTDNSSTFYYVKNVDNDADAQSFYANFPQADTDTLDSSCGTPRPCTFLYKPVCGVIKNDKAQTYSNACFFRQALRESAGTAAPDESKGYYADGPCPACDYNDPAKKYVIQDSELCKAAKFACEPGTQHFFNDCGCGCETVN